MELLDFIFRLGVVFAIYGFLWGLIEFAFVLLTTGRKRSIGEIYLIKALKYFFLVDVTFLFCLERSDAEMIVTNQLVIAGLILLTYFIGKFQNKQQSRVIFQMMNNGVSRQTIGFHPVAEVVVIILSIVVFSFFAFYPEYARNPLSIWFHESIINIEDTPVFGFIFKVIGFFFLLNLMMKMSQGLTYLLSGQAFRRNRKKDDDGFDDFTEIG